MATYKTLPDEALELYIAGQSLKTVAASAAIVAHEDLDQDVLKEFVKNGDREGLDAYVTEVTGIGANEEEKFPIEWQVEAQYYTEICTYVREERGWTVERLAAVEATVESIVPAMAEMIAMAEKIYIEQGGAKLKDDDSEE